VSQLALEHVADDLHVAMAVRAKAHPGFDAILGFSQGIRDRHFGDAPELPLRALDDIARAFPYLDRSLIGHDTAYSAMLVFLPHGMLGLMVAGLLAAYVSTISTHLNWGTSYLVHDLYRRFIRTDADEAHYVRAGRVVTLGLFLCSAAVVYLLDTAKDAFDIILQVGAGTGLLYLVRWFWWRVNAWCEIVAMISSLVQLITPDEMRGRVMSMFLLSFVGTMPIGNIIAGAASNEFGPQYTLAVGGLVVTVVATGVAIFNKRLRELH